MQLATTLVGLCLFMGFAKGDFDISFEKCSFRCGGHAVHDKESEEKSHKDENLRCSKTMQTEPSPQDRSDQNDTVNKMKEDDQTLTSIGTNGTQSSKSCPQTSYVFSRKSSTDYIRVKTPLSAINDLSLCAWVKVYGTGSVVGALLSYATPSSDNTMVVIFEPSGRLSLASSSVLKSISNHPLKKGLENHICVVFSRARGFAKVFYNATFHTRVTYENRNPVAPGGAFVIGQDQDSLVGGFNIDQALHGEIRNYMVWDRELTDDEIADMYNSKCNCAKGHVIALTPDQIQLEGGVNAVYAGGECNGPI